MILLAVELALLLVVALLGWLGAGIAIDGTLAAAAARAQAGDIALVRAAGEQAAAWFAGGLVLLAVVRGATGLRRGQHIRTPLLLPAVGAACALGLVVQLGYGNPFRADWPGPGFAQGVFYGCLAAAAILALPGDIGAWISRGRWIVGGGALALLVALALFGEAPGNSGQRINLFGAQPIELVKIGAVLFAADALGRRAGKIRFQRVRAGFLRLPRPTLLVPALVALLATWAGLFLVKDLGPTLILGAVFLGLFYLATRSPGWVILALATIGLSLAFFALAPELAPSGTVQTRLRMWSDPWLNGLPNGDQLALGFWAMAAGGWNGSGLGTAFPGGIPAGHTDLVYAHLVEELGVVGALGWLALLAIAVTDGLRVAARNRTPERALMAAGLGMLLVAQAATILGGTFGAIPLTGVVVPFLSFGKTSMVAFWAIAALVARLGEDGEARVVTDELRELAGGVRHVQIAVALLALLGVGATIKTAVIGRDETTLRGVVTTLADGTPVLLQDRRLSSIANRIRRGDILDRNGEPLATSPVAGTREHPLGDALGTVLGPAGGGLLRAKWSVERQQETLLRGYPDKADGPAIWLGRTPAGERLLLAAPSAANEAASEQVDALATYTRLGGASGSAGIRRIPLATPDLTSLLPLARMPLADREAAITTLSDDVASRTVKITLDAKLQAAVAPLVKQAAAGSQVGAAALVVLDAATGEVLARAQWPDYDPGGTSWRKQRLASDEKFMGAYGAWSDKTGANGVYQAGSTFKVLTALLGVREGRVRSVRGEPACPTAAEPRYRGTRNDEGRAAYFGEGWTRAIHGGRLEETDLVTGIAISSNIYFGQLAMALGPDAYRGLLEAGVEFGNPGLEQETDGDFTGLGSPGSRRLAQTGFGQGAGSWNVTQAARLTAAVASGGIYRRCAPSMVMGEPCETNSLLDDPTELAAVLAGMDKVTPDLPGVRVYGKTGTADAPGRRDEAPWNIRPGQDTRPHSWLVSIAEPAETDPCSLTASGRYALAGVVPHGGSGRGGAAELVTAAIKELRTLGYLPTAATAAAGP